MTQNRSIATTQRILKSTAIPTKTVEARKAWLRMDEKFTRLPMHFKVGSDKLPSITDELEPTTKKQYFQSPKCPGLLEFSVAPTHSSLRKTTIFKIAEQKLNTPQSMATDFDCLRYKTEYLVTLASDWAACIAWCFSVAVGPGLVLPCPFLYPYKSMFLRVFFFERVV